MKKTKRIAAMIAALAMMATMAVPFTAMNVSAVSQPVKVSVKLDKDNVEHTYKAYEIFKGENVWTSSDSTDSSTNKLEFMITDLGGGVNWSADNGLLKTGSDFMNFAPDGTKTIAEVIAALGEDATNPQKAAAIARVIGKTDADKADELAKIFEKAKIDGTDDGQGTKIPTAGVEMTEGYYLVTDSYDDANNDAVSKFILQVAKKEENDTGIVIVPKKSYPEVIKKVQENTKNVLSDWVNNNTATTLEGAVSVDEKWNDVADYNIGDAVPFQLYGSLPETLADYSAYYYLFTDTLGTQFDQPEEVTVGIGTKKTLTFTLNNGVYTLPEADQLVWNYASDDTTKTVNVPNTDGNARVTWDNDSHKLLVSFEDIKEYGVAPTDIITVYYTAVLNDTAVIGLDGQENKVDLTYTNNPNFTYSPETDTPNTPDIPTIPDKPADFPETPDIPEETPDTPEKPNTDSPDVPTDKTPEDRVVVFTYEIDINKIDGDTKAKLKDAEFSLRSGDTAIKFVDNGDGTYTVADQTLTEGVTTKVKSDANGLFKIIGLDSGSYTLTEMKAPEGYNLPAEPDFGIVLNARTVNTQKYTSADYPDAEDVLTKIEGTIAGKAMNVLLADSSANRGANGGVEGTIENNKGTELPGTGGMGTILFYTVGGIMVVGAGVVLVTKKRSKNEQ